MPIEFKDNLLDTTILDIIKKVKQECPNNYFKDIIIKHDYIRVTCPYHKGGHESNPSCSIYCGSDSKLPQGILHCFTCGEAHTLDQWVGYCFNKDAAFGEEWLLKKFCNNTIKTNNTLLPIEQKENNNYIDPSILNDFKPYHPYMTKRKLTEEIIKKFNIKYDPKTESIVFPVWDEHNKLVMLTKRNVNKKLFFIDENKEKPVYLLNNIINNNIKTVYVCESQINTLTLYG